MFTCTNNLVKHPDLRHHIYFASSLLMFPAYHSLQFHQNTATFNVIHLNDTFMIRIIVYYHDKIKTA